MLRLCSRFALLHEGKIAETALVEAADEVRHPELRRLLQTLPVPARVLLQYTASSGAGTNVEPDSGVRVSPLGHLCKTSGVGLSP